MTLNVPKAYSYVPNPVGAVKLTSRSSRRGRLWTGGTYFRSVEYGQSANLIQVTAVEDLTDAANPKGLVVVQHTVLKPVESISVENMSVPSLDLYDLQLAWNEEIRITKSNGLLGARKYGISWQIARGDAGYDTLLADLGTVTPTKVFSAGGVTFRLNLTADAFPDGATVYLRPRTSRYPLGVTSYTDPTTALVSTGWDIVALRGALNGTDPWVYMPGRTTAPAPAAPGSTSVPSSPQNEDAMDTGFDDQFLTVFGSTNLTGGDGLPATPAGLNTGPDRSLVHLNYSELPNGSLGELNQVFEWVGDTATSGSWQRYS